MTVEEGLSPRTRGSPPRNSREPPDMGSIPAHAGEPPISRRLLATPRVYPRARGGTLVSVPTMGPAPGLSPRTRGSLCGPAWAEYDRGSIPAHAGEPRAAARRGPRAGVYPRARGGAILVPLQVDLAEGLSPRTRGSRALLAPRGALPGSIPAHAGEPDHRRWPVILYRVYPRARGGAARRCDATGNDAGLSPRTRGSPRP